MEDPEEGDARREERVEDAIKGMRVAAQRMKEDIAKAQRKTYPRQYADSAIGDAEFVIQGHLERAMDHMGQMQIEHVGTAKHSLGARLDNAESDCAVNVMDARITAEERWPAPMD
jgi:hypothetical protein